MNAPLHAGYTSGIKGVDYRNYRREKTSTTSNSEELRGTQPFVIFLLTGIAVPKTK